MSPLVSTVCPAFSWFTTFSPFPLSFFPRSWFHCPFFSLSLPLCPPPISTLLLTFTPYPPPTHHPPPLHQAVASRWRGSRLRSPHVRRCVRWCWWWSTSCTHAACTRPTMEAWARLAFSWCCCHTCRFFVMWSVLIFRCRDISATCTSLLLLLLCVLIMILNLCLFSNWLEAVISPIWISIFCFHSFIHLVAYGLQWSLLAFGGEILIVGRSVDFLSQFLWQNIQLCQSWCQRAQIWLVLSQGNISITYFDWMVCLFICLFLPKSLLEFTL